MRKIKITLLDFVKKNQLTSFNSGYKTLKRIHIS